MKKIFISYSRDDQDIADNFYNWLDLGIKEENIIFKDNISIGPENIRIKIFSALEKCLVFISLYSENYFKSNNCLEEWNTVKQYNNEKHTRKIVMINVIVSKCQIKMGYKSDRLYDVSEKEEILKIINSIIDKRNHKNNIISEFERSQITLEKQEQYSGNIENSIEKYSEIFRHILLFDNKRILEKNIFKYIGELLIGTNKGITIKVKGYPGYGKSTFLLLLYYYIKNNCTSDYFPIYINLNLYNKYSIKEGELKLNSDLQHIVNYVKGTSLNQIYIVDGFNDYFKKTIENEELLYNHLKINSRSTIVASNISDNKYIRNNNYQFFQSENEHEIIIHELDFNENKCKELIRSYSESKFSNSQDIESCASNLYSSLKQLNIKTLDLFVLKLIYQKEFCGLYRDANDYIDIIKSYIFNHLNSPNINIISSGNILNELSKYSYEVFMDDKDDFVNNYIFNDLIYNHFIVRDYLLALFAINNIIGKSDLKLQILYPYEVNKFCKFIMNQDAIVEEAVFNSIESMLNRSSEQISIRTKTHLYYLLGRIKNELLALKAIALLEEQKKTISVDNNSSYEDLLLIRTIYISLVFLGVINNTDTNYSEEYLNHLMSSNRWDALNRGFHLEYYGDIALDPKHNLLTHKDNLGNCKNTYYQLRTKIYSYLDSEENKYPLFEIEVFTLVSLIQHRSLNDNVDNDLRDGTVEIINKLINENKRNISLLLKQYLEMMFINLQYNINSIAQFAYDLFHLKSNLRAGWSKDGMSINRIESIADHTMGTILLAKLFLPEKIKGEVHYCKDKIINILLFHDIGEAYTTDIATPQKLDIHRSSERESIMYLSLLKTYNGISDFSDIANNFFEFENFSLSDINFKIAKDLDNLDNLFQLNIYKKKYYIEEKVYVNFKASLISQIKTNIGRNISRLLNDFDYNKCSHIDFFEPKLQ